MSTEKDTNITEEALSIAPRKKDLTEIKQSWEQQEENNKLVRTGFGIEPVKSKESEFKAKKSGGLARIPIPFTEALEEYNATTTSPITMELARLIFRPKFIRKNKIDYISRDVNFGEEVKKNWQLVTEQKNDNRVKSVGTRAVQCLAADFLSVHVNSKSELTGDESKLKALVAGEIIRNRDSKLLEQEFLDLMSDYNRLYLSFKLSRFQPDQVPSLLNKCRRSFTPLQMNIIENLLPDED